MQLSIVIPSYNHEQYVLSTIRTAARIDVPNKEIIVIDDGSSDDSVRLIREYIAGEGASANIRFLARENRGVVRTLNEALALAQGKYIYLVASDDVPIPQGVASLVHFLEQHETLQFVLGNALFMDSEEQTEFRVAHGPAHRRFFDLPFEQRRRELYLRYPQPILMQAAVFRTSAIRAVGGWPEDIVVDDYSLFLRMFSQLREVGKDFDYRPEIMAAFYRRHPANHSRNLQRQFMMIEQALAKLCPPEFRNAALFRNLALHGYIALRTKKLSAVEKFIRSTAKHIGWPGLMRTSASELKLAFATRISGTRLSEVPPVVMHDSAAAVIRPAESLKR